MPSNTDNSNEARLRRLKARTIANYNRLNPQPVRTQQSFTDGSLQNSLAEGRIPYYQQTDTQTRTLVQGCCTVLSCDPPEPVTNISASWLGSNPGTLTWTGSSTATSYTVTSNSAAEIVSVSGTSATFNVIDGFIVFTITAINQCGSTSVNFTFEACFPAGTKVHIADGTTKNIEDIQVGDIVIGAFGEHNPVIALQHVLVGNSKLYKINDEHITTDHHPHISADKKFFTIDIKTIENKVYGTDMPVIYADGKSGVRHLDGLMKGRVQKLALGLKLKTIDGDRELTKLEEVPMDYNTKLYNLVTGGSHPYHADGYAVTGWPSEKDFDYDTWTPK